MLAGEKTEPNFCANGHVQKLCKYRQNNECEIISIGIRLLNSFQRYLKSQKFENAHTSLRNIMPGTTPWPKKKKKKKKKKKTSYAA